MPNPSSRARVELLKEWNQRVRHLPPADRLAWLEAAAGLVAHGAKQRKHLVADLRAYQRQVEESACSSAWIDARWHHGERYDGHGMAVSTAHVRFGDGPPTPRLTPPIAVGVEDFLDSMPVNRAMFYDYPPSPSALSIRHIRDRRGHELDRPAEPGSIDYRQHRKPRLVKAIAAGGRRFIHAAGPSMSTMEIVDSINAAALDCQPVAAAPARKSA